MLDIRYIVNHCDEVKENIRNRRIDCDIDKLIDLYQQRNQIQQAVDNLRMQRNDISGRIKSARGEERFDDGHEGGALSPGA